MGSAGKEESICLSTIQRRWDSACQLLFKRKLGPIMDYAPWLCSINDPIKHRKSSISGREISFAIPEYREGSKWAGFSEALAGIKFKPLSINEVKDLESLVEGLSDRFYYAGSSVLGNSGFVEKSSNITDSFYMYETGKLSDCKYVAFATLGRLCEDNFGGNGIGESQFCVRTYETFKDKRCFELWMGQYCSDCFYSHNLNSCQDCFFCFNMKNARHSIGNLALEPSKYRQIRDHLVEQVADGLEKAKRADSLIEIAARYAPGKINAKMPAPGKQEKADRSHIDAAFEKTCLLLFGAGLGQIDSLSTWLVRHTRGLETRRSALSGNPVHARDYSNYFLLPRERMLTEQEAQQIGPLLRLSSQEAESISMENAGKAISGIAYFTSEYKDGSNSNLIECPTSSDSSNCYRSSPTVYAKYCGYSFWPRSTQYAFGCDSLLDSEFCVNCYHSVKLKRCFEMDYCRDCSDCMFCHNSENMRDSLFCFNAKNMRYAVGNQAVGKAEYERVKSLVMGKLAKSMGSGKDFAMDVYSIGAPAKAKK